MKSYGPAASQQGTRKGSVAKSPPHKVVGGLRRYVPLDRRPTILHEHGSGLVNSLESLDVAPLMTVEELAALLQASKGAIYARLARGGIPGALRLGRTLRFDRRVIVHWLSASRTSAGGQS